MFSSSNNTTTNNHPSVPSSIILGHHSTADDIFQHHRQDLFGPHFGDTHNINMLLSNTISSTATRKRSSMKKDRHSKICTAQGVRDRRVRLSIQIARKFFDLQDMLGFDKASKTLEWLFSKSTTAIMELTHSTNNNNKSSLFSTTSEEESRGGGVLGNMNENPQKMKKKKMMKQPSASQLLAKELRAKARARARARTTEKMCSRRLDDWKKFLDASPLVLNQYLRSSTKFSSPNNILSSNVHSIPNQVERNYFVDEPILIKRKLSKPSSAFGNYHQNPLVSSKDVTSNSNTNNDFPPTLPQNWGTNSGIGRTSFCAMHNMSLSTELQIFGEHYETHNNQSLH